MISKKNIFLFLFIVFLVIPSNALAQSGGYVPLAPIDGVSVEGEVVDINSFIPNAIKLGIGIAGVLSVIFIMIGGLKYIVTDVAQVKTDAKDTIQNAVVGLLLAIGAYAILNTINPKLVDFQINIQGVRQGDELPTTISFGGGNRTYTNLTAEEVSCVSNCVSLSGTGLNLKGGGSEACSNDPCYLNSGLVNKLQSLKSFTDTLGIGWQVTEAFPPTTRHESPCHNEGRLAGRCVDIALTGDTSSTTMVTQFIYAIRRENFSKFIYEKCPADPLKGFVCTRNTRGEHAHVEL